VVNKVTMVLVLSVPRIDTQISSVHDSIGVKAFSKEVEFSDKLFDKDTVHCFFVNIQNVQHITLIKQLFQKGEFEP
jgi:hypothetical protein